MAENKSEEIERRGSESSGPGFGLVVYPSEIVKIKTGVFTRVLYRTEYFCGQVSDSLRKSIEVELDQGLAFKLIPVFLGLGIALYFSVPEEPSTRALIIAVVSGFVLLLRQNSRNGLSLLLGALLLLSTGMLSAKFATERTISPHLTTMITSEVVGVVLNVDHNRRGAPRYLIKPFSIEKLAANELPERLRLSAAGKGTRFEPGTVISGLARVQPVLGPVFVGGYDFSFFARFEKLGGSGFFMGPPSKIESKFSPELGFRETLIVWINSTRFNISDRIQRSLPGATGKIATALVVGDKTGIPQNIQEALRATGLAHILAISGLHMALVTLTVIWIVRIGLAVKTDVLVTRPVKKWAAAAGLAFASLYLLLSGAGVATQRAWIMICVMLFAILADRKAITMRSVSISATLILLVNPHNILMPGFQMSFAAVIALVAAYQSLTEWRQTRTGIKPESFVILPFRLLRFPAVYIGGIALTSLIAGAATSFVAVWHFQQFAPFGLIANMIAMPIVTSIIMPAVLLAIVLMPFGLEFVALIPVSHGIDWVVGTAFWVQNMGSAKATGLVPGVSYALFLLSLLLATQLKTKLRILSVLPLAAFPLSIKPPDTPDILIAESGRTVVVKGNDNNLLRLLPKRENFVSQSWGKAYGNGKTIFANLERDACNRDRCIVVLPSSLVLHIVYAPALLKSSCKRADILIAPRLKWVNCRERMPKLVLKRGDFEKNGTHAIHIAHHSGTSINGTSKAPKIMVQTALPASARAWHRDNVLTRKNQ